MSEPMLAFREVDVFYGVIQALKQVTLEVNKGETVALIGANGAGKSTLLMSIFGQPRIRSGQILFGGEDISHKSTHYVASGGIAQAPEGRRIFPDMTVEENLLMGTIPIGSQFAAEDMQTMFDLFPRLKERRTNGGGQLSGGEQQMLSIGRALMNAPRLLMLDEPVEGLAPVIVEEIVAQLKVIKAAGVSILLVEQNLEVCTQLADRHYIIEQGTIVYQGSNSDFLADEDVKDRYLGVGMA